MQNKSIRRYFVECTIFIALAISLSITACFYFRGIGILVALAIAIAMNILIRWSASRNLHSILIRDMDPMRYQSEVLNNKYLRLPSSCFAACALAAGNYQTVLDISAHTIAQKNSKKVKCYNLTQMARVYFELGDIPRLRDICAQYDSIAPAHAKEGFMTYYRHYAAGEYQACLDYCRNREAKSKKEKKPHVGALNIGLHTAFALAQLGDQETAEIYFAAIERYAPNMHAATIARGYLTNGTLPQILGLTPRPEAVAPAARRKNIVPLLIILSVAMVLLQPFFFPINNDLQEFDSKLETAVAEKYTTYQILDSFSVEKDGRTIQTLCIIQSGDQIDVLTVTTPDDGQTFCVTPLIEDFQVGMSYYAQSPVDQQYYHCGIIHYEPYLETPYALSSFSLNGSKVWAYVDYIGENSRSYN